MHVSRKRSVVKTGSRALTIAAVLASGLPAPETDALGVQLNEYPTTVTEAEQFYESDPDLFLDGPAEYIVLKEERELWDDLEATEQRQAFIDWFWARRDDDPRDSDHPFKREFYERVATTNQRFRGFPRGWKSDRGRVWVTIGRPDSMSRRSWGQVVGYGAGPDFEVWTYYTNLQDRGFRTSTGEFYVLFLESRPGRLEIWDRQFGTGSWDPELRRAFDYTAEHYLVDPQLEFGEADDVSDAGFVRSVTESSLAIDVPLTEWGAVPTRGLLVLPAIMNVRDLLFESSDEGFVAEIDVEMALFPESGGDPIGKRREWAVRLTSDQLAEHGGEALVIAMSIPAAPGRYDVRVGIYQPLADATGLWNQEVEIGTDDSAGKLALGTLAVALGEGDEGGAGLMVPDPVAFNAGQAVYIGTWPVAEAPDPGQLRLSVEGDGGGSAMDVVDSRWFASIGQLVIESRVPELQAGEYTLTLEMAGHRFESARFEVLGRDRRP